MGQRGMHKGFWWGSQKEREHRRIWILVEVNIKIDHSEMG
jgi:hypothetical protein